AEPARLAPPEGPLRYRSRNRRVRTLAPAARRRPRDPAMTGRLVVVATPIGNLGDLSPRAAAALGAADVVCCEDTRHSRKLFTALGIPTPKLIAVHKDNEVARCREILDLIADGNAVALITDAGTPAVSDPGRHVVEAVA